MQKIVLASASQARLAILRNIGLKPRVIVSAAKEQISHKRGCAGLVVSNALIKAQAVASRLKSGIVIGADTVVSVDGKIIGKPKDKADAFRTLKLLSRYPQYVYSSVAVIDVKSKQVFTDYARTKVYMRKLSDSEIRDYIENTNVANFAGSFDIQGKGALFIERIDGCYYTVVGLPLVKLAAILESMGIKLHCI